MAKGKFSWFDASSKETVLQNPGDNTCHLLSGGGAVGVHNDTDKTAELYSDLACDQNRRIASVEPQTSWDSQATLKVVSAVKFV